MNAALMSAHAIGENARVLQVNCVLSQNSFIFNSVTFDGKKNLKALFCSVFYGEFGKNKDHKIINTK